jgi:hypothetical protein
MPLFCNIQSGATVPGKPTLFAVVRPQYSWESPPVAILITVHAFGGAPSDKVTKTQMFYPARARWSPNLSMSIDLGFYYSGNWPYPTIPPSCKATYEVARHTQP